MVFSITISVCASSDINETVVVYSMDESFVVTIPDNINIDSRTMTGEAVISAYDINLKRDFELAVIINGSNYDGAWKLVDVNDASRHLNYTIGTYPGGDDIVNNHRLISVINNGNPIDDVEQNLYFTVLDNQSSSGVYTDTLTFVVSLNNMAIPFEDASWSDIITSIQAGYIPPGWEVGSQKQLEINDETYWVRIIGMYHDEYADGSGLAPITLQLIDCYNETSAMNTTDTTATGWSGSYMRTTTLENIFNQLPIELQDAIKPVKKYTIEGPGKNPSSPLTLEESHDKLFLLSEYEVFGAVTETGVPEGEQYDFYKNGGSRIKKLGGSPFVWWLRSPRKTSKERYLAVYMAGQIANGGATSGGGVAFAFCIG